MTSASAATASTVSVKSAASDGFFSGASALISVLGKSNPIAGIISSGLLGAFKTFYNDATKTPQPSTQEIVDLINQLSDKIDSQYNAQTSQEKALEAINKLQSFANILTSAKGYNESALGQIALFKEDKVCAQDYKNIIKYTSGDNAFKENFMSLSNLITGGQPGIKGKPSFMQYLDYSKACKENNNDAAVIKKDCEMFNKMTLEQYALYFTNLITGCLAEYNLAELEYKEGSLSLQDKNSLQGSITSAMNIYYRKAKNVVDKYNEVSDAVKNLTVAKVTVNGVTTEKFSFGDAWVEASKNGGTMQLVQDWKTDNFAADVYYYDANKQFKDGALYVSGQTVTLDLNGHSIIHKNAHKYDLFSENGNLTLKDSSGNKNAVNGILAKGGNVTVDGVTIRESADAGIRADDLHMTVKNTTFINNRNSAVVTGQNAYTTIDNCFFRTNRGSAVYNSDSYVTIRNSFFDDNRSDSGDGNSKAGGAIYSHSKLTVENCKFANNKAEKGGAIFTDYITSITNCLFEGNRATNNGGAVIADYRGSDWCFSVDIESSIFKKNNAGNEGGAVYCDSMNYLSLKDVEIQNNTAGANGGGLYCKKGAGSSCDPFISGRITIVNNRLSNGAVSNAFLDENTTSKCIFKIDDNIDPNSRIGVTSPTTDKSLDICRIWNKSAYENAADVFSYDNGNYRINRYTHFYSDYWYVEIVRN